MKILYKQLHDKKDFTHKTMALTPEQKAAVEKFKPRARGVVSEKQQRLERIEALQKRMKSSESFGFDFIGDIRGIGTGIKQRASERTDKFADIERAQREGEQGVVSSLFQKFGQGAGLAADVVGEGFKGAVKAVLPQRGEEAVKGAITDVAEKVAETPPAQAVVERWENIKETNPVLARELDAILGIGSLAVEVAGLGAGGRLARQGGRKVAETAVDTTRAVKEGAQELGQRALQTGRQLDVATGGVVGQLPRRIRTNVQSRGQFAKDVENLAQQTGQAKPQVVDTVRRAVTNGVDKRDVGTLAQVSKSKKAPEIKELYETAKRVAQGDDVDLAQLVGRPAVNAIQKRKKEMNVVGERLSEVSQDLGKVSRDEAREAVVKRMKEVPGLSGLKVDKRGRLDFSDTALTLAESASDRKAIQSIFSQAIRSGTGASKHKIRQNIFNELLKKDALGNIKDTQSDALEAVRKGLADVLDSKNSTYKNLNKRYAELSAPVKELNRRLKAKPGSFDDQTDILEISAGNLARRITSNAQSRAEIYDLFKKLGVGDDVKDMQEALNVFSKYLDIENRTSLGGIIESQTPTRVPSSPLEVVGEGLRQVGGRTDEVTQQALDELMQQLF